MKMKKKEKNSQSELLNKAFKDYLADEKAYIFNYNLSFDNKECYGACALSDGKLYFYEEAKGSKAPENYSVYKMRYLH